MTTSCLPFHRPFRVAVAGLLVLALPGCNLFSRLSDVGTGPELSQIQDPQARPDYTPVSLPMPAPLPAERNPNSLWRHGARSFFKDQRASRVGDILTILINIDDSARIDNTTARSREAGESAGLPNLLGLEPYNFILPADANPSSLVSGTSSSDHTGQGRISRQEAIELRVAAIVTQLLPNGNMVIEGRQEVRVNYEVRDLYVTGVIRPEDISARNSVGYDKIAEARISYGGRGQISDVQQPRYGQQVYDILFPF